MSPALRNLWLLLVYSILIMVHHVRLSSTRSAHQLLSEVSQTRLTIPEIDTFISDPTMHKGPLLNKLDSRRLTLIESFGTNAVTQVFLYQPLIIQKQQHYQCFLSPNAPTQITGQPLKKI